MSDYDYPAMRKRLVECLEQSGISMRAASIKGDAGKGYLQSVIKDGVDPTIGKMASICAANNFSLSYVLFGLDVSPETERLMALMEASEDRRKHILALLEQQ